MTTMVDVTPPAVDLAFDDSDAHVYADGENARVYYGPFDGSFTVTADASDSTSRLAAITFPNVFNWFRITEALNTTEFTEMLLTVQ